MRLFVGVRPPDEVLDEIAALVDRLRPSADLRWTTRDKWHVTLRFLGNMDDTEPLIEALSAATLTGGEASLGPAVRLLGGKVVCIPVAGLDDLARTVTAATAEQGRPPDARPFTGHVTLARLGRKGELPRSVRQQIVGSEISATWPVTEIVLVRSHLSSTGASYEDLAVFDVRYGRKAGANGD